MVSPRGSRCESSLRSLCSSKPRPVSCRQALDGATGHCGGIDMVSELETNKNNVAGVYDLIAEETPFVIDG